MFINKCFCCLFLIFVYANASSQNIEQPCYLPQAPTSQSLAQSIDIPVSCYTGVPEISIPIMEVKVGNYTLPISLSYHASGIRMDQEATEVGLGWNLNVGGEITRTVKSLDDFKFYGGYLHSDKDWDGIFENLPNYYDLRLHQVYRDLEHDIFFYSNSSGSGKFFFDHDGWPHFTDKTKNFRMKSKMAFDSEPMEIIDSKGNCFVYDVRERTINYVSNVGGLVNVLPNGYDVNISQSNHPGFKVGQDYVSSWKLSKIITQTGDTIQFFYEDENYQLPIKESAENYVFVAMTYYEGDLSELTPGMHFSSSKSLIFGKRLSEIRWNGGKIKLYRQEREDIVPIDGFNKPQYVSNVSLYNAEGEKVQSCDINCSYFSGLTNTPYPYLFKRLRLDSVNFSSYDGAGYRFTYNEQCRFPAKNTKNTDYWGYYNGSNQGNNYVCEYRSASGKFYSGGDKKAQPYYTSLGTINSITNPEGGTTKFTFENNVAILSPGYTIWGDVHHTAESSLSTHYNYEGVEAEVYDTITLKNKQAVKVYADAFNYDDVNHLTDYVFTDRNEGVFELYSLNEETGKTKRLISWNMPEEWDMSKDFTKDSTLELESGKYILKSKAIVMGFVADMSIKFKDDIFVPEKEESIGGLRIAKIEGEKEIEYEYNDGILFVEPSFFSMISETTNFTDGEVGSVTWFIQHSESMQQLTSFSIGSIMGYSEVCEKYKDGTSSYYRYYNRKEENQINTDFDGNIFYYRDVEPVTDWNNGLLLEKEVIDSNNQSVSRTIYQYESRPTNDTILGYKVVEKWNIFSYRNIVKCPLLVYEYNETSYGIDKVCCTTKRHYNDYYLCDKVKREYDKSQHETNTIKYPFDFSDSISKSLVDANMVSIPIEQTRILNGVLCSKQKTLYDDFGNKLFLPKMELCWNIETQEYDTLLSYKSYTKNGRPIELNYKTMPIAYIWSYGGLYPIAEIYNMTKDEVENSLNLNIESFFTNKNTITEQDVENIQALKNYKRDVSVTTCRYLPLVGVTEITAPTGLLQTFRYDDAGRLSQCLFGKSELHNVYRYRYADETNSDNYVENIEYLNAEKTDSIGSIQYYDIWGRSPLTSVLGVNTSRMNIWSWQTYDNMGRPDKSWTALPSKDRLTEENFAEASKSFFGDAYAYSQTTYDALGRTLKVTTPGKKWHDENRVTENSYNTNGYQEVRKYKVIGDAMTDAGYYGRNTLTCTTLKDPDGNMSSTYKDMFGNVVLERRGGDHDTYYVYDDYNRLRFVLSPKYQDEASLDKFAYEYRYDGRGNVIYKKLPGCKPIEYEYDKADRVIKMQDGLLRAKGKYRVYEYDGLGRLKKQSIADSIHVEYDEFVNFYDNYDYLDEYSDLIPENKVDETDLSPLLHHSGIGLQTGVLQRASNGELLLMSYSYDDHGRVVLTKEIGLDKHLAAMGYSYNFAGDLDYDAGDLYRYDKSVGKLNDNSLYSWTKHYFQESNNKLPYRSVIHLVHKGSTRATNDEIMKSTYDDFGRVIANDRKGTAGDMTYAYDNLHGWLKQIGSASGFRQTLFRETGSDKPRWNGSISAMTWNVGDYVDRTYNYTYDGLNRLISADYSSNINAFGSAFADPENRGLLPWDCLQENYSESFRYDKNCNITFIERMGTTNTRKGQEIDVLALEYNGNQLKNVCDYSGVKLTYSGAFDFVDREDLSQEYAYNENGAMTKDLNKDITNIEYDLLGNPRKVTMTNNRSIEYVYAADGRKLRTIHSAPLTRSLRESETKSLAGKGIAIPIKPRIRKTTTDYINNYVFEDDKPVMYRFPGGYYSFDAQGNMEGCHFYVQDYQGNNRMVVNAYSDTVEQVNHYYSYGALIGDISTNPDEQKYKYSGKELDRTYGLDLHDFEARQQDPLIGGRFTSIDPSAHKYYWLSPYSYCAGDPINFIDPNGMDYVVSSPNDSTIVVLASIYVLSGDFRSMIEANNAASFWNGLSGQFSSDGKTVEFKIDVIAFGKADGTTTKEDVKNAAKQDKQGNYLEVVESLPKDENGNEQNGTCDGKNVKVAKSSFLTSTAKHELGHALGLIHEDVESDELMTPNSNNRRNDNINSWQIKRMINNAITGQPDMEGNGKAGKGFMKGIIKPIKRVKQLNY